VAKRRSTKKKSSKKASKAKSNGKKERTLFDEVENNGVESVPLRQAAQSRYLNYSLSVITSRALPDVRDGMKPVQRRILYTTRQLSLMAQPFSLRMPLIDGSGNFGSIDGDNAAAMRYTECRRTKIAGELLSDLNTRTVAFRPNYDGSREEPVVLPSRIPNLLLNGATGIAVGMATNIPPHNLKELCNALLKLLKDPEIKAYQLVANDAVQGPDFPVGGQPRFEERCRRKQSPRVPVQEHPAANEF